MMVVTHKHRRYVVNSEATLIALVVWLQLRDVDERAA